MGIQIHPFVLFFFFFFSDMTDEEWLGTMADFDIGNITDLNFTDDYGNGTDAQTEFEYEWFYNVTNETLLAQVPGYGDSNNGNTGGSRRRLLGPGEDLTKIHAYWPFMGHGNTDTDLRRWDTTPVQDPFNCLSEAFAVTAEFETNYNIKKNFDYGDAEKFAEQFVLDCGNHEGADCDNSAVFDVSAAARVIDDEGHCSQRGYDIYTGDDNQICDNCDNNCHVNAKGTPKIIWPFNNFEGATKVVGKRHALMFRIDVYQSMKDISAGHNHWYQPLSNDNKLSGHAMTAVGQYVKKSKKCVWFACWNEYNNHRLMVKNSWGIGWANNGYAWFHKNAKSKANMKYYIYHEFDSSATNVKNCNPR